MKLETVLNATNKAYRMRGYSLFGGKKTDPIKTNWQYAKFRSWILRRDEKQAAEIARLQKQLSVGRSLVDNAPVWAEMANCPPDTVIGIQYGQILEWQAEIARLQAQVNDLEEIRANQLAQMKYYQEETARYSLEVARLQAQVKEYSEALSYFTTMNAERAIEYFNPHSKKDDGK